MQKVCVSFGAFSVEWTTWIAIRDLFQSILAELDVSLQRERRERSGGSVVLGMEDLDRQQRGRG